MNFHVIEGYYVMTLKGVEMEALWDLVELALDSKDAHLLSAPVRAAGLEFKEKAKVLIDAPVGEGGSGPLHQELEK